MFFINLQIIKVSQLNRYVKAQLDDNTLLKDIMLKGELTSVSYRSQSGHYYFTVSDEEASLRCVMFSQYAEKIPVFPEEGALVIIRGQVTLYERDGQFQLVAYDIQAIGCGSGSVDYAALRMKLAAEGLFEPSRKKELPCLPRAVGIITAGEGAAVQDIITGMARHNAAIPLVLYPATVQGAYAVESMLSALRSAIVEARCDVLILGRGGGAAETLAVFNDERLLRAVAECPVPVISAIGHDVDYTLMDEIADARAATPTAACQYCCISAEELKNRFASFGIALQTLMQHRVEQSENRLSADSGLLRALSPRNTLVQYDQRLKYLQKLLSGNMVHYLWRTEEKASYLQEQLRLLDPLLPVDRGYTVTGRAETPLFNLTSCRDIAVGQKIVTKLRDGEVYSTVTAVIPKEGTV